MSEQDPPRHRVVVFLALVMLWQVGPFLGQVLYQPIPVMHVWTMLSGGSMGICKAEVSGANLTEPFLRTPEDVLAEAERQCARDAKRVMTASCAHRLEGWVPVEVPPCR